MAYINACLRDPSNMRHRANKETSRGNFFFFAFCLKAAEHCYDAFPPWYVKPRVWKSNHRNALLCQWKSDLYRNMIFWRWILKVFKRPRKPTAEKSTSENPRRKRLIFVMENMFCRKVRYSKHQRNGFLKDCIKLYARVFDFPPSDLMRPRYCCSADSRMRMQNALLLPLLTSA